MPTWAGGVWPSAVVAVALATVVAFLAGVAVTLSLESSIWDCAGADILHSNYANACCFNPSARTLGGRTFRIAPQSVGRRSMRPFLRLLRISPAPSELYPFVFFSLWVRSNK